MVHGFMGSWGALLFVSIHSIKVAFLPVNPYIEEKPTGSLEERKSELICIMDDYLHSHYKNKDQ